jgi:hypothetical protein
LADKKLLILLLSFIQIILRQWHDPENFVLHSHGFYSMQQILLHFSLLA